MFTIARNERTSYYEIHKDGCAHTNLGHMEVCASGIAGESGESVAIEQARGNEGCAYTTGPCVKRGKREVFWGANDFGYPEVS